MESDPSLDISDVRAHQRWLIDNGFINDLHKDQLYLFGAILHKDIKAVELQIDVESKSVNYLLYAGTKLLKKMGKYETLSKSTGIIGLWRFRSILKREGNLNFSRILDFYIKDYCGQKWKANVKLMDFREYKDGYEEAQSRVSSGADKQPDS
jgi:hypothetical protein